MWNCFCFVWWWTHQKCLLLMQFTLLTPFSPVWLMELLVTGSIISSLIWYVLDKNIYGKKYLLFGDYLCHVLFYLVNDLTFIFINHLDVCWTTIVQERYVTLYSTVTVLCFITLLHLYSKLNLKWHICLLVSFSDYRS